jgi:hypothetical protein
MSESSDPGRETVNDFTEIRGVHFGKPLDVAEQLRRNNEWQGECPGPTEVGRLEVPQATLDLLESELGQEYGEVMSSHGSSPHFYSDSFVGDQEGVHRYDFSPDADAAFVKVKATFKELLQKDIEASSDPSTLKPGGIWIMGGQFAEQPDVHLDVGQGELRYIVTLIGSGTEFIDQPVDPHAFDEGGDLKVGFTITASRQPVARFSVVRFLADADPHTTPVVTVVESRLIISGTTPIERPAPRSSGGE